MRLTCLILTALLSTSLPAADMGLQECLERALGHNLDVTIQKLDTRMIREQLNASKGIFDPTLRIDAQSSSYKSASAWQLEGAEVSVQEGLRANTSVTQVLPTGGSFSLSFNNSKTDTNSIFYSLNPYYSSTFELGFSHPLLQGYGSDITRYQIILYGNSHHTSVEQLRQQIMSTILEVENAYWDLRYARADLEVKQKDLELAKELLDETQKRIQVGTQAPIDIYQAQVGVATREEAIIRSRSAVEAAEDHLKNLLNYQTIAEWDKEIIPIEAIHLTEKIPDLEESMKTALSQRPDIRIMKISHDNKKLDFLVAKNDLLPRLDLNLGYWYSGTGGDYVDRDPVTNEVISVIPGGISDAYDQIKDRLYDNWTTALTFTYPIGNRQAKANKVAATLNLEKSEREIERLNQTVFLSVRNSLRNLRTARESLNAAEASRTLAEKNLDAERKKYENGMTTSFQVLEVEAQLSEAKTREIQALINHRKALAEYHYSIGSLLSFEGIEIAEEESVPASRWDTMPVASFGWWSGKK